MTVVLLFILFIPVYFLLFQQYKNPKASILWGRKWMYKEEVEVSEGAIKYAKVTAVIGMLVMTIIFFFLFLSQLS